MCRVCGKTEKLSAAEVLLPLLLLLLRVGGGDDGRVWIGRVAVAGEGGKVERKLFFFYVNRKTRLITITKIIIIIIYKRCVRPYCRRYIYIHYIYRRQKCSRLFRFFSFSLFFPFKHTVCTSPYDVMYIQYTYMYTLHACFYDEIDKRRFNDLSTTVIRRQFLFAILQGWVEKNKVPTRSLLDVCIIEGIRYI